VELENSSRKAKFMVKTKSKPVLHDKQSERDDRELRIDKVGVRGLRFPIQIRDKAHALQNTVATIGLFVDLPRNSRAPT
jgi:GTP cyclohydrolase I